MIKYVKNIGIVLGFGIVSLIASIAYYWALPYFLDVFLIVIPSWKPYFMIIAPAPVVIWIASWLFSIGYYYIILKLIKTAEIIIVLSIGIGIAQFFYQLFNS